MKVFKKEIIPVLIVMLLLLSACSPASDSYDSETAIRNGDVVMQNTETAEVTALVEGFGAKLKSVYLTSPPEIVRQDITEHYGDYVHSELLMEWVNDPQIAPGRLTSSPWPERIEILSMEKLSNNICRVQGKIIEVNLSDEHH